jgi:transcriptional regulator with XRE-family HTH domain/predicted DNA-binding transcriptional regulator AlpA
MLARRRHAGRLLGAHRSRFRPGGDTPPGFFLSLESGIANMPKRLINKETASDSRRAMAERLLNERLGRHWTQTELAKRARIQSHVISNIESGHTLTPLAEPVLNLCKVLGLRPEWFLDGEGEKFVPGPVEVKTPEPVMIERVPLELAKTLLKVIEEMQYSRLFCPESLSVTHVDRWLGDLLGVPELRAVGDHFMRAAMEAGDPAQPGARPTLVVNNVNLLPRRTVESAVVLPKPEAQPVMQKTAALRVPPPSRASTPTQDGRPVVVSFDPFKGTKLGKLKKGSYTDIQLRKRGPMRKDGKLRQSDVCAMLGISASSFWLYQTNDPDFPKPVELSNNGKAIAYDRKDFEQFLRLKIMQGGPMPYLSQKAAMP